VGRSGVSPRRHLGGTLEEIAACQRQTWEGDHPQRPFVLLSQPTLFDPSRAPHGRHIVWAYCHVPRGSNVDMLPRIEQQIERFAPGFRERVIARAARGPADIERQNPNFVGGDIAAGATTMGHPSDAAHVFDTRPRALHLFGIDAAGVGVHGMCGYFAAQRALREVFRD
jgi:phytoene dehydrogenase-like protein